MQARAENKTKQCNGGTYVEGCSVILQIRRGNIWYLICQ